MKAKGPSKLGSIREGDRVESQAGWTGTVVKVSATGSLPVALVKWDKTGSIGRHTITTLHKIGY